MATGSYEAAPPFLADPLELKAVISHHDVRSAAFRGLIATGIKDIKDADAVTALMRKNGVQQYRARPVARHERQGRPNGFVRMD